MQEMDAYDLVPSFCDFAYEFPVNGLKIPLLRNNFPVSSRRELDKSPCGTAVSQSEIISRCPKFAKFPVKFPDSREIARRRARSALRRQPGSPALGETIPDTRRKPRQWRAFANWPPVSEFRFWSLSQTVLARRAVSSEPSGRTSRLLESFLQ